MAVKHSAEVTISDLTDGFSVSLSRDSLVFQANTTKAGSAQSASVTVEAAQGLYQYDCSVTNSEITIANNSGTAITNSSSSNIYTGVTKASGSLTPVVTINVKTDLTCADAPYTVTIPVSVTSGSDTLTYTKQVTVSLPPQGATGAGAYIYTLNLSPDSMVRAEGGTLTPTKFTASSTRAQGTGSPQSYQGRFKIEELAGTTWTAKYTSSSNEASKEYTPTSTAEMVRVSLYLAGGTSTLLATRTVSIANDGATGGTGPTGKGVSSVTPWYKTNNSTTAPSGSGSSDGWSTTPTAPTASNKYLWSYDVIAYTSGDPATTAKHIVGTYGEKGEQGEPGDDPYTLSITSDNGVVLRNNTGQTTLTAHVFQAGAELGTMPTGHAIKWYVDGTLTETDNALPATFTRTAAQVTNKCVVCAKLEG